MGACFGVGAGMTATTQELQEFSKLAYRALEDCHRVLWTIVTDDDSERAMLSELRSRVQDLAVHALALNGTTSFSYKALKVLSGHDGDRI